MPHIIIEHSLTSLDTNIQETLLDDLFNSVTNTKLFAENNIKVRLHPISFFKLATSHHGFIHIQCRIHTGRSQQEKQQLSESILLVIQKYAKSKTVITVEVIEMDTTSYAKVIVN